MTTTARKPMTNVKTFDELVHQQDVEDVKATLDSWVVHDEDA